MDNKRKSLFECSSDVLFKTLVDVHIVYCHISILLLCCFEGFGWICILKCEAWNEENSFMFLDEIVVSLLRGTNLATCRNHLGEFTAFDQFFQFVQSSDQFSLDEDLRIGGPLSVMSCPVPHLFISNDVIISILDLVILENFQQSPCETALGLLWGTFDESNERRTLNDAFHLWVPDCLFFGEVLLVLLRNSGQCIEYLPKIFNHLGK